MQATFVRIKPLVGPDRDELQATFSRMAELLADAGESGELQFRIVGAEQRCYSVALGQAHTKAERPSLEIVTRAQTWWEIAAGSVSPLQAMIDGKLRVRGDMELGERLLQHLAAAPGRTSICEVR
jgi:putative sterol carrier protein